MGGVLHYVLSYGERHWIGSDQYMQTQGIEQGAYICEYPTYNCEYCLLACVSRVLTNVSKGKNGNFLSWM